jgi:DNA-directed RNA polymerase specialized sigma24 family protein
MNDGRKGEGGAAEYPETGNHEELIKSQFPKLLAIAKAVVRDWCSDPEDHKNDVAERGIVKFLQAESKRATPYDTPVYVLRMAVRQEALRHRRICLREVVTDFNETPDQLKESDPVNQVSYSPHELAHANSYDPHEMYDEMLDFQKRMTRVTDPDLCFLRFIEGRTLEEIATLRGWKIMQVQRMVEKLRKELGIYEDEGPSDN